MANVDTDLILRKTLEHFKKSDADIHGMLARSTVVWVQRWKAEENASPERMKAGAGEWVTLLEGPLFVLSRQAVPFYQMIVRPRSPSQQAVTLAVTKEFGFVPKKPNLHLTEDDSKESTVYNFHFPGDAEGSESFDRIAHVLQSIMSGAAHSLVPLVQMESSGAAASVQSRMIKIDDLFPTTTTPSQPNVHTSSLSERQASKAQNDPPDRPNRVNTVVSSVPNHQPVEDRVREGCDADGRRAEAAGPMTATQLLAKLNTKLHVSGLLPAPGAVDAGQDVQGRLGAAPSVRNVPPPPPPVPDEPVAAPNIIAQLFGLTASKAPHAAPQHLSHDAGATTAKPYLPYSAGQAVLNQPGLTEKGFAESRPAEERRASARQLFQILLQDHRFLDAVADAVSAMSTKP